MRALIGANVRRCLAGKMFFLLALNTLVAIVIGLVVANVIGPGKHASLPPCLAICPRSAATWRRSSSKYPYGASSAPSSITTSSASFSVAVAFGMAARRLDDARKAKVMGALEIGFDSIRSCFIGSSPPCPWLCFAR